MWPRHGTVLTVTSRALIAACERLGVDTEAMLRTVGIQRQTLEDPDARLQNREVSALWAKAYELSGDPVLSLHVAEACPLGAYKVIDYMAATARTVGEAFRYAARYFKLINTAVRLPIDESGDRVTFDIVTENSPAGVSRQYAEFCLAVCCTCARRRVSRSSCGASRSRTGCRPTSASTSGSSAAPCVSRRSTTACISIVPPGRLPRAARIRACSGC